jgi:hypothetical protein
MRLRLHFSLDSSRRLWWAWHDSAPESSSEGKLMGLPIAVTIRVPSFWTIECERQKSAVQMENSSLIASAPEAAEAPVRRRAPIVVAAVLLLSSAAVLAVSPQSKGTASP